MEIDQFLAHFEDVSKSGDGFRAKCSAHKDKTPSLSISEGADGKILIYCHSKCTPEAVLSAVGLTLRDLYPSNSLVQRTKKLSTSNNSAPSKAKPATVLSEEEIELGRTNSKYLLDNFERLTADLPWTKEAVKMAGVGYDSDTSRFVFIIRNIDGAVVNIKHHKGPNGEAPYSVDGHGQNCLFPGQEIRQYNPNESVILCEGEKDAVTLLSMGFQAITGTAGATSVVDDLSLLSNLKRIDIFLDHGEAGQKGAEKWAADISVQLPHIAVCICKWPRNMPEGFDVTTFFKDGHSPDDFKQLRTTSSEPYFAPAPSLMIQPYERHPIVIRMSDVKPANVEWLWFPYIPLGKLTIMEGDPGDTKSWLALSISATVTRGDPFPGPDGLLQVNSETPGTVIYCTAEDGIQDTLHPRLDALRADLDRVFVLDGWRMKNSQNSEITGPISLQELSVIEQAIVQHRPRLLVIDPIQAFIGSRVDINRTNEVRPILAKLGNLAEKYRTAIVCIRHITKQSGQGKAVYRGQGSIDFTAAARSVILVAPDPLDPNMKVIAHTKSNLSLNGISQRYEIRNSVFYWRGTSDLSADELLGPLVSREARGALDFAMEFLLELLSSGSIRSTDIFEEALQQGISRATLRRAKTTLGIKASRIGGIGQYGRWNWSFPYD